MSIDVQVNNWLGPVITVLALWADEMEDTTYMKYFATQSRIVIHDETLSSIRDGKFPQTRIEFNADPYVDGARGTGFMPGDMVKHTYADGIRTVYVLRDYDPEINCWTATWPD